MGSEGADKIVHEIVRITDDQVGLILQEARKDADKIRGESEKTAQAKRLAILAKGQQQAEREHQRILADAKMQVKREIFDVKEDLIKEAFGDAEARLKKLAEVPEYVDILKKLIVEAGRVVGGGPLEVLVRREDRSILSGKILADLSEEISKATSKDTTVELSGGVISTIGGAIVRSKSGSIEADNTIESRINRIRSELRFKVAEILFGGAS
ncbi:MAG: V-type ATP synthase subunit E family protein [Methanothrix sp.]|jgi:V/A-type H+-transporting ATPase subunit E|nr:V-type ATP synthase subunit E family protein [Methanothrix sp.]OPX81262.1 MAG: V-type ATP synthase subunit E [Methanosaeta sp. PtaB.Bin087]NLX39398.1 V-type ATP synthase subunit E [Methanothrix sp.]HOI69151.1 V-type ATP synthase subunit E family protein [Methanothrix sp.]HPY71879.1 V-type ATP synthase subunit E family protein [Methanothrix sp.]